MLKLTQRLESATQLDCQEIIELNYDERKRGRLKTQTVSGKEAGLFLERGKCLQNGDLLQAESGELIEVRAAKESVTLATASDPIQFAKICYHLGNRHLPLQIGDFWIRFQPDYVLEDLCKLFGLQVQHEKAPFQPENGAYGQHGGHSHGHHGHDDDHNNHHHEHNHHH